MVVAAGGYVGYAAIRHSRPVTLPAGDGAYRVGRTVLDWTDRTRTDPLAPRPGTPRALSVWLWYPAPRGASGTPAPYAPGAWGGLHFGAPAGLGETAFDAVRTRALTGVPVAAGRFPVVVLEPGLGFAAPQYTAVAESLARRGYLVAGVTPTYSANLTVVHGHPVAASPAGDPPAFDDANLHAGAAQRAGDRLVRVWAGDARFAAAQLGRLDRSGPFAGHVDGARTVYIGHSFGGAAALQACHDDARCAGAVDLDGTQFGPVVHAGLTRPSLTVASDSCVTGTCRPRDAAERTDRATARTLLAASTGPTWCYRLAGARHLNFTDYAAYYLAAPLRSQVALGSIDGARGLAVTAAYVGAFLDHVTRGRDEPLLRRGDTRYREMHAQRIAGR